MRTERCQSETYGRCDCCHARERKIIIAPGQRREADDNYDYSRGKEEKRKDEEEVGGGGGGWRWRRRRRE